MLARHPRFRQGRNDKIRRTAQSMNDHLEFLRSALPGMSWPALPDSAGAMALAMQFQLDRTQWLPSAELENLQMSQLQLLMRHARDTLPFWRERLDAAGFDPQRKLTPELFRSLPLLLRSDIQTQGRALLCTDIPQAHGGWYESETSGST
ncbi:MAG: hypothetical protein ACTS6J_22105, partial [Burkholderiales bacterium]